VKIKLDENIPTRLIAGLSALGHEVDSVMQEDLTGRPDPEVWAGAQASRRLLITQDLDFSDIRHFQPGTHHGIILVRLRRPGRKAVAQRVLASFIAHDVEQWARCFVVITDLKVRVHRPS
jgi:predicted nuclease of predicted toxin-antitoxin system